MLDSNNHEHHQAAVVEPSRSSVSSSSSSCSHSAELSTISLSSSLLLAPPSPSSISAVGGWCRCPLFSLSDENQRHHDHPPHSTDDCDATTAVASTAHKLDNSNNGANAKTVVNGGNKSASAGDAGLTRFDLILLRTFHRHRTSNGNNQKADYHQNHCAAIGVMDNGIGGGNNSAMVGGGTGDGDSCCRTTVCSSSASFSSAASSTSAATGTTGSAVLLLEEEEEAEVGVGAEQQQKKDQSLSAVLTNGTTASGKRKELGRRDNAVADLRSPMANSSFPNGCVGGGTGLGPGPGSAASLHSTTSPLPTNDGGKRLLRRHSAFHLPTQRLFGSGGINNNNKFGSPPARLNKPPLCRATTTTNEEEAIAAGQLLIDGTSNSNRGGGKGVLPPQAMCRQQQQATNNENNEGNVNGNGNEVTNCHQQHHQHQPNQLQANSSMGHLLEQMNDGMELAFERCKVWSKYATQLLAFVRSRLALEQEYGQRLHKLAEQHQLGQQQQMIIIGTAGGHQQQQQQHMMMPLAGLFSQLADAGQQFAKRADTVASGLQRKFVANLEQRQKEHDTRRRKLKTEYAKQRKQLDSCAEELRRARQTHTTKGEQYLRAREVTLRQEHQCHQMLPSAMQLPNGQLLMSNEQLFQKKRKEVEKRRRAEEDALSRKSDAESEVCRLERELDERRARLAELRCRTVHELSDLIRQCELTTIACASHLLRDLADLWAPVPRELERLAEASRASAPGAEFMSFLRTVADDSTGASAHPIGVPPDALLQSSCSPSSAAIIRQRPSTMLVGPPSQLPAGGSTTPTSASMASSQSPMPSPCRSAQRRNALTAAEEHQLALAAQHKQKRGGAKTSVARLFDHHLSASSQQCSPNVASSSSAANGTPNASGASSSPRQPSDAARSHRLQRTRQVTKCAQCEHLLLFDALKCQCCGLVWHRKCLTHVQLWCGPSAARHSLLSDQRERRTSIFGVPLRGHLEAQHRQIPLILERCLDELQRRGMCCKGLYRTCGVKSKVEELCLQFEQRSLPDSPPIELADVHPMNIASVVKLYLRRLPEPLLSYDLYADWLQLDQRQQQQHSQQLDKGEGEQQQQLLLLDAIRRLVQRLPEPNVHTLRFLALHLNRVTWFEAHNLMSASNLAAVIAPSLLWQPIVPAAMAAALNKQPLLDPQQNNHHQHHHFINDAHRQTHAVELLIRHAFSVFGVDRQADWAQFFAAYPEVPEPCASETTTTTTTTTATTLFVNDRLQQQQKQLIPTAVAINGEKKHRRNPAATVNNNGEFVGDDDGEEEEEGMGLSDEDNEEEEEEMDEDGLDNGAGRATTTTIMPLSCGAGGGGGVGTIQRTRSLGLAATGGGGGADSGVGSSTASVAAVTLGGGSQQQQQLLQQQPMGGMPAKRVMESSSSDLDCGSSAASTFRRQQALHHPHNQQQQQPQRPPLPFSSSCSNGADQQQQQPPSSSVSSSATIGLARPQPPGTAPSTRRQTYSKQRSFTTSILVSPLAERRGALMHQQQQQRQKFSLGCRTSSPSTSTGAVVERKSSINGGGDSGGRRLIAQKSMDESALVHRVEEEEEEENNGGNANAKNNSSSGGKSTLRSGEVTVQLGKDCLPDESRLCMQLLSAADNDVSYV